MNTANIAAEEKQRLTSLLFSCHIRQERIDALEAVIDNTAWMKAKLDEARDAIKNSSVAIPYDNGGGQKGIRENPLFKGYEALFKSYMSGISKILDTLPEDEGVSLVSEEDKPKTVLEFVRAKRGQGA